MICVILATLDPLGLVPDSFLRFYFALPEGQRLRSSLICLTFMILCRPNSERNDKKLNRSHFTHYKSLFGYRIVTTLSVSRTGGIIILGGLRLLSLERRPAGSLELTGQTLPDLAITSMISSALNQCKRVQMALAQLPSGTAQPLSLSQTDSLMHLLASHHSFCAEPVLVLRR